MIKFGLLICYFFITFQDGNSQSANFGTQFFGACPEVKSRSVMDRESLNGEWYTQWVLDNYSPWRYLSCQSNVFEFKSSSESPKITMLFALPIVGIPFEIKGNLQLKNRNEFTFNYNNEALGNVPQKTVILENYNSGTKALVWTCLDFQYFHFESVQVMTKDKESPESTYSSQYALKNMEYALKNYGLSSKSFVKVDQSCN